MMRTIVVNATYPLGVLIARRLAESGTHLLLVDHDEEALAELDYELCQSELHRYATIPDGPAGPQMLSGLQEQTTWSGILLIEPPPATLSAWIDEFARIAPATLARPGQMGAVLADDAPLRAELVQRAGMQHLNLNAVAAPRETLRPSVGRAEAALPSEVAECALALLSAPWRTARGVTVALGRL